MSRIDVSAANKAIHRRMKFRRHQIQEATRISSVLSILRLLPT